MSRRMFITGGARSGKSSFALSTASAIEGKRAFIATMQAFDDECSERIRLHKEERGDCWDSFEEPLDIIPLISRISHEYDIIVLDCLTLWLTNLTLAGDRDISSETSALAQALAQINTRATIIIVTNEVGMGIVPENALSRSFRDHAGTLNRKVAQSCDEAYLVVSGIPIKIKPSA